MRFEGGNIYIKKDLRDNYYWIWTFLRAGLKNKQLEITLGGKDAIYETNRNVTTDDIQQLNNCRIFNIKNIQNDWCDFLRCNNSTMVMLKKD